jgi:GNAT superfamily N-acetyltransferase
MNDVTISRLDAADAPAAVAGLADLLVDCVEGGASVSFMLPLTHERALAFWREVAASAGRGERVLLVATGPDGTILGTAQLVTGQPENQPHRADVAKVLVARRARRRGIAARLMAAIEEEARRAGKTCLVLDTVTGGDAERLYARAGWTPVGIVPSYALMPTGEPCATTYFYKHV